MDNHILVERHYLTPQMYREIYMRTHIATQMNMQNNQQFHAYNSNIANNSFPNTIPNNLSYNLIHTPVNRMAINQQNNIRQPRVNTNANTNANANTNTNNILNNLNQPSQIRNLISNLVNTNIPFQLEVSTLPINQFINRLNANLTSDVENNAITFANVNTLSNVVIYNNSNSTIDMCSICQGNFENNDIVRKLNNCGHLFHLNCIDRWLAEHNTCPTCRNNLTSEQHTTPSNSNNITQNNSINRESDNYHDNEDDEDDDEDNVDDIDDVNNDSQDRESVNSNEQFECECEYNCHDCENHNSINSEDDTTSRYNDNDSNSEINGFTSYFIIANTRQGNNTSNASNVTILTSNTTPIISNYSNNTNANIFSNRPITSNTSNTSYTSNTSSNASSSINRTRLGISNEFQIDLNNLINIGAPFLNTVMGTSNTTAEINPSNVNNQVNNLFQSLNPLLTAFNGLLTTNNNHNPR